MSGASDKPVLDGECGCNAEGRADPNGVHRNYHIYAGATPPALSEYVQVPREPTKEMLEAFQRGFHEQLRIRHQCRHKPEHQLTSRQTESAEQGGLRAMLAAVPAAPPTKPLPEAGREICAALLQKVLATQKSHYGDGTGLHLAMISLTAEIEAALKAASPQSSVEEGEPHDFHTYAGNWTEDFAHENGNYMNTCCHCGKVFLGHKRRPSCKVCTEAQRSAAKATGREAVAWLAVKDRQRYLYDHDEEYRALSAANLGFTITPLFTTPRSEEDIRKAVVEVLQEIDGCFEAALREGWADAYASGDIERIRDLYDRRISFARTAAIEGMAAIHSPADRSAS